jgi:hypothetical protein
MGGFVAGGRVVSLFDKTDFGIILVLASMD